LFTAIPAAMVERETPDRHVVARGGEQEPPTDGREGEIGQQGGESAHDRPHGQPARLRQRLGKVDLTEEEPGEEGG
jgi:hypothetical protein